MLQFNLLRNLPKRIDSAGFPFRTIKMLGLPKANYSSKEEIALLTLWIEKRFAPPPGGPPWPEGVRLKQSLYE